MKYTLTAVILFFLIHFTSFAQSYTIVDSLSRIPISNVKIEVYEEYKPSEGKKQKQLLKTFKSVEGVSKVIIKVKGNTENGILIFKIIQPNYQIKEIAQAEIQNNTIELIRKGVTDEYSIKLATLKKKLTKAEISKLKSQIDVEGIEVIKREDGRYAYITKPIKNLRTCIEQLNRIKNTKNSLLKDAYILYGKNNLPIYFRVQLEVARKWMENEFTTPKYALERYYKLDQIITSDKLYRVVSEKKYDDYNEALGDYLEKVKVRIPKAKGIIIACQKIQGTEIVITPLSIN